MGEGIFRTRSRSVLSARCQRFQRPARVVLKAADNTDTALIPLTCSSAVVPPLTHSIRDFVEGPRVASRRSSPTYRHWGGELSRRMERVSDVSAVSAVSAANIDAEFFDCTSLVIQRWLPLCLELFVHSRSLRSQRGIEPADFLVRLRDHRLRGAQLHRVRRGVDVAIA